MATITYTLDPVGNVNDGYTRTSFANIASHYSSTFGSLNLSSTTNNVVVILTSNLSENYNFGSWTTSSGYTFEVYSTNNSIWSNASEYNSACVANGYFRFHNFRMLIQYRYANCIELGANAIAYCLEMYATPERKNDSGGAGLSNGAIMAFCFFHDLNGSVGSFNYGSYTLINCTVVNCNYGVGLNNYGDYTIQNTVCFNNGINWNYTPGNVGLTNCFDNAGESGDTVPGSGTITTVTNGAFTDANNGDFSIIANSVLRHTHVDFPTGNNISATYLSYNNVDFFGHTLPSTYITDDDRWDIGFNYYVAPVTGTTWRISNSEITNNTVTLADDTIIEDVLDSNNTSTLGAISSGTDKDTLRIVNGLIATLSDTANGFSKRGIAVDIADGELIISNNSTITGMQWWGWLNKLITIGPLGKFSVSGEIINLCTVANADNGTWSDFWGIDIDDLDNYPEPSVIFCGVSLQTAVPYLNKGTITSTVENNSTHGNLFAFDATTGNISFPDNVPTSTHNVYIYNCIIHSKDGQSTNLTSFGIDTTGGGSIDIANCYHTGALNFTGSAQLSLINFGILQPINIDDCQNVSLNVYRGASLQNSIDDVSTVKNLTGESLGAYYSVGMQSNINLYSLINVNFTALTCFLYATQTADNYPVVVGSSSGGTDLLSIDQLNLRGGGIQFTTAQSNNTTILELTHSNDCTGNNASNLQHVVYIGSSGTRGLQIDSINLASGGDPCNLDIINMSNSGNFTIKTITYNGNVRNIAYFSGCFSGLLSGFTVAQISGQPFKFKNSCKDITIQNGYSTSTGTVAAFDYYSMRDIRFKNTPYQDSDEYSLDSWTTGAMPDVNFLELNKYGTPYTGVLVQNFYRSSKGEFTFMGSAKSNKNDAVLLPAIDDSVVVTTPYRIKVGASTSYFQNTPPTIVGTGANNFTIEYRLNVNGGGYGAWATLNATNLSNESFAENDEFLLQIHVTCDTAGSTNEIRQIILYTNPDETVQYPVDTYTLTVDSQNGTDLVGAQISLYDNDSAVVGDMGTEMAESNNNVSSSFTYVHYGVTNSIFIQVIKPGYVEQVIPFTLLAENQTVYINLALDENE